MGKVDIERQFLDKVSRVAMWICMSEAVGFSDSQVAAKYTEGALEISLEIFDRDFFSTMDHQPVTISYFDLGFPPRISCSVDLSPRFYLRLLDQANAGGFNCDLTYQQRGRSDMMRILAEVGTGRYPVQDRKRAHILAVNQAPNRYLLRGVGYLTTKQVSCSV